MRHFAAEISRALDRQKIYPHHALVRLVVVTALEILSETMSKDAKQFIERYRSGELVEPPPRKRLIEQMQWTYRHWLMAPTVIERTRTVTVIKLKPPPFRRRLNDDDLVAMYRLRRRASSEGDTGSFATLDRVIRLCKRGGDVENEIRLEPPVVEPAPPTTLPGIDEV